MTPNAVRILVQFDVLGRHQEVIPALDLFRRHHIVKAHGTDKGWFYICNRNNTIPKLVVGAPTLIKNWKRDFVFVPAVDFPWGFWWRPIKSKADHSAEDHEKESFQKLMRSGLRLYSWNYPEAMLVDGGISRALLNPDKPPFISTKLTKPCNFSFMAFFLLRLWQIIMFVFCTVVKLSDIITSGSAEVAKRSKRKSSGETSAPPPKKKTQGQVSKTSAAKSTPATAARPPQPRDPPLLCQKGCPSELPRHFRLLTAELNN